jgi:hypothetical protein
MSNVKNIPIEDVKFDVNAYPYFIDEFKRFFGARKNAKWVFIEGVIKGDPLADWIIDGKNFYLFIANKRFSKGRLHYSVSLYSAFGGFMVSKLFATAEERNEFFDYISEFKKISIDVAKKMGFY